MTEKMLVDFEFTDETRKVLKAVHLNLDNLAEEAGYILKEKAIPIEFIKKEMESSRYIWSNSDVKTELYWRGVYQGLMVLIRNWEKENAESN